MYHVVLGLHGMFWLYTVPAYTETYRYNKVSAGIASHFGKLFSQFFKWRSTVCIQHPTYTTTRCYTPSITPSNSIPYQVIYSRPYYRVTRYVVNDFKWQINYARATKYLLSCYQRLGKFNTIMCTKYHNRPLLSWFIRANILTSPTKTTRLTLTFFCSLLHYFSVVLYKWVL